MISSLIENSISSYGSSVVVGASVLVGIVGYPVIKKIAAVALSILGKVRDYFADSAISIRMHSLWCNQCAENHRRHMDVTLKVKDA